MESKKTGSGFFNKIVRKVSGQGLPDEALENVSVPEELSKKIEDEFEAVKRNPGHLTGWDFDRAFDFIERHPDTSFADILLGQMYATTGQQLKGLSYSAAVKVLELLPGHAGVDSIIQGMYKIEGDFIHDLEADVIAYILQTISDHPLGEELAMALVDKNFTHAYSFITENPENVYTKGIIKAMFDRDPNVAVLLLQEKMDHPQVSAIFEGIYRITKPVSMQNLTPNAIMFILDIAPDHPNAQDMIEILVAQNYIKAYDFITHFPDHTLVDKIKACLLAKKPELQKIFDSRQ